MAVVKFHLLGAAVQLTQDPSASLNQHLYQDTTRFVLQLLLESLESNKSAIKEWIHLFYCDNLHEDVLCCSREKITVIGGLSPGKTWPWGRNYHGRCSVPLFLWGFVGLLGSFRFFLFVCVLFCFLLSLVYFSSTGPQEFTNSDEILFCRRLESSGVSKTCCCLDENQHIPCMTLFSQKPGPSSQDELQGVSTPAGQPPH